MPTRLFSALQGVGVSGAPRRPIDAVSHGCLWRHRNGCAHVRISVTPITTSSPQDARGVRIGIVATARGTYPVAKAPDMDEGFWRERAEEARRIAKRLSTTWAR